MTKNLKTTRFADGSTIQLVEDKNNWTVIPDIIESEFLCFFFSFETKVTAASEHLNSYIKEDEKEVLGTTCILWNIFFKAFLTPFVDKAFWPWHEFILTVNEDVCNIIYV